MCHSVWTSICWAGPGAAATCAPLQSTPRGLGPEDSRPFPFPGGKIVRRPIFVFLIANRARLTQLAKTGDVDLSCLGEADCLASWAERAAWPRGFHCNGLAGVLERSHQAAKGCAAGTAPRGLRPGFGNKLDPDTTNQCCHAEIVTWSVLDIFAFAMHNRPGTRCAPIPCQHGAMEMAKR